MPIESTDGWITYPNSIAAQEQIIDDWRTRIEAAGDSGKPAMQSLCIDLLDDTDAAPEPIHLGFRSGITHLRVYIE